MGQQREKEKDGMPITPVDSTAGLVHQSEVEGSQGNKTHHDCFVWSLPTHAGDAGVEVEGDSEGLDPFIINW